jgi:hypothetical protein
MLFWGGLIVREKEKVMCAGVVWFGCVGGGKRFWREPLVRERRGGTRDFWNSWKWNGEIGGRMSV